ncbi:MAG TPA: NlpC/P60 family protein [Acidimicrobiales bacterium]|nr:NlpC/P60 family protein [Acidimicrobiales bacterium]
MRRRKHTRKSTIPAGLALALAPSMCGLAYCGSPAWASPGVPAAPAQAAPVLGAARALAAPAAPVPAAAHPPTAAAASAAPPAPASGSAPVLVAVPVPPAADGLAEPDGSLWTLRGSWPSIPGLARPVLGWTARPGGGAWEVAGDGGIFSRGGAPFYGSTGNIRLNQPIVGMAATPDGGGYWLVASDGGVFTFGDAGFFGSTGGIRLNKPVVGMAAAPDGQGYWLVAADGGIFPFGSAVFAGSASGRIQAPAVSVTANGDGYDVAVGDGTLWSFRPGAAPAESPLPVPASELAPEREARLAQQAVDTALAQVGKPYSYGAAGPGAYDCSGLAMYSYATAGIGLPRTSAAQFDASPHVPTSDLQPGDLVFFGAGVTHVGLYVGDGRMVDAPHPGASVRVESYRYFGPMVGATRPTLGH